MSGDIRVKKDALVQIQEAGKLPEAYHTLIKGDSRNCILQLNLLFETVNQALSARMSAADNEMERLRPQENDDAFEQVRRVLVQCQECQSALYQCGRELQELVWDYKSVADQSKKISDEVELVSGRAYQLVELYWDEV